MNSLKETAEFYRCGLKLGLLTVPEVLTWLDAEIVAQETPHIALIEASLSGRNGPAAVADWLAELPGEFDVMVVARRLLSEMHARLTANHVNASHVSRWLYDMVLNGFVPENDAEGQMYYYWDALDLATEGIYGNPEELRKELEDFLARFSSAR